MKNEYLKEDLKTKQIFFYKDIKEGIDILSREVFKNKALEIHYPFGRDGKPKYKYIKSIEFLDISPKNINGIYKAVNFGLGFTRNLSPIIYRLEDFLSINKIIISSRFESKIERTRAIFNSDDLGEIFNTIKPLKDIQSEELKRVSNNALAHVFPKKFSHKGVAYKKGQLSLFIKENIPSTSLLSDSDVDSLIKLIPGEIREEKILYKAQEKINFIKLKRIKSELSKIVSQKTNSNRLEERCHKFFIDNPWIFSNILSMPVVLLGSKVYVGGKDFENKGGKEADFLFKNNLTKNHYCPVIS
jgi:hypothetical protein